STCRRSGSLRSRPFPAAAPGPCRSRRWRRDARPALLVRRDEKLPELSELPLDVYRGRSVSLRVARMVAHVERLAEGDRDRVEVTEAPVLRAVNRAADDGRAFLDGDHGGAGQER